VADAGALPEAAAGAAAAVLPVDLVPFPTAAVPTAPNRSEHVQQQDQQWLQHICAVGSSAILPWPVSDELMNKWQAGQCSWHDRVYPQLHQQHLDAWATAVQQVLSSRSVYEQHSMRARAAAEQMVLRDAQAVQQQLVAWLTGDADAAL
jgi:hypothetical protein